MHTLKINRAPKLTRPQDVGDSVMAREEQVDLLPIELINVLGTG